MLRTVDDRLAPLNFAAQAGSITLRIASVCLAAFFGSAGVARADRAEDLARIHVEAIGGKKHIEALAAVRMAGQVTMGAGQVRFTMTAARPDRVRLETVAGGRTLVQGTDGVEPPWELDTGTWPPRYRSMDANVAKTFVADAEFDDPLVAGESRGYTLDYAGEIEAEGKKLFRVLVTRNLTDAFSLLLDQQTFFIVMRVEQRVTAGGRKSQVVTHYEDFRPVKGVLLPHHVTVAIDGRVTQETKISRIDPDPVLTGETFSRPKVAGIAQEKS